MKDLVRGLGPGFPGVRADLEVGLGVEVGAGERDIDDMMVCGGG